jgi:ubiquinone/menaquinone biosynthesis C-methylase UbiE
LQHCFEKVFALDISEGMIEYAKKHITGSSVSFLLGDGENIPLPDSSVTSVFSTHVFQHFDSLSHASDYFKEIERVLVPGGTMMIHLPVHHWPAMPGVFELVYRVRKRIGDMRAWIRRRLIRAGMSHHFMRGLSYPVQHLFDILPRLDFVDVEILVFQTTSERAFHAFVFARRKQQEA